MESIKDIFLHLLLKVNNFGKLINTNYYSDDFATIVVERDGKVYTFSMRSEEDKNADS